MKNNLLKNNLILKEQNKVKEEKDNYHRLYVAPSDLKNKKVSLILWRYKNKSNKILNLLRCSSKYNLSSKRVNQVKNQR